MIREYKNNLFCILIESPFQLLCAYEAVEYFGFKYQLYIRLTDHKADNLQIKNLAKELGFRDVKYIYIATTNDFMKKFTMLKYLMIFKLKKYDYYLLGNYLSGFVQKFVQYISKRQTILLDDGVATFQVQRELQEKSLPLSLFTIFDVESFANQHIYKNEFKRLKSKYSVTDKTYDIFIGGQLVDLDLLSLESYIGAIKTAILNSKTNKLIYFPHRRTSTEVINEILLLENIEIAYPDTTIEYYLLKESVKPNNIYSIISSALFSLSILFEDANAIAYKPVFKKNDREKNIEKLYEIFNSEKNSIKLINLG